MTLDPASLAAVDRDVAQFRAANGVSVRLAARLLDEHGDTSMAIAAMAMAIAQGRNIPIESSAFAVVQMLAITHMDIAVQLRENGEI